MLDGKTFRDLVVHVLLLNISAFHTCKASIATKQQWEWQYLSAKKKRRTRDEMKTSNEPQAKRLCTSPPQEFRKSTQKTSAVCNPAQPSSKFETLIQKFNMMAGLTSVLALFNIKTLKPKSCLQFLLSAPVLATPETRILLKLA